MTPNNPDVCMETTVITKGIPVDDATARRSVPAWIISTVAHAVILGLLTLIAAVATQEKDPPAVQMTVLPPLQPDPPPVITDSLPSEKEPLPIPEEAVEPNPIESLEVTLEDTSVEETLVEDIARGEPDATSDTALADQSMMVSIGSGGNAGGPWGRRGLGKKRAVGKYGTPETERTVDRSLKWFKRHQSPNGQWDIDGYPANCQENPKCEPGLEHTGIDGDLAGTGYALLCFLGAGFDHRMPSPFRDTVSTGVTWLVSQQGADGSFGPRNYEHAIATMALAEAFAMSNDRALRAPAQKAVDILLQRQIRSEDGAYGLGWDYTSGTQRNDASVTGWCAMALKSAAAAGLNTGDGMAGVKNYLDAAWLATNPGGKDLDPYTGESTFPYTWNSGTGAVDISRGEQHKDLASVGALLAVFLGHEAGDPMLESLCNYGAAKQTPTAYPTNTYYLYYNTLALFMADGDQEESKRWHTWNKKVLHTLLVDAQHKDEGCLNGSWDWGGTVFHGHRTGRILSTAYCCLSLEVYYRYVGTDLAKRRDKKGR